jgi:nucleoside-diphosphate-sugar epimerase
MKLVSRWFIAGINGSVGRKLAAQLLERGCEVTSSPEELDDFMRWLLTSAKLYR